MFSCNVYMYTNETHWCQCIRIGQEDGADVGVHSWRWPTTKIPVWREREGQASMRGEEGFLTSGDSEFRATPLIGGLHLSRHHRRMKWTTTLSLQVWPIRDHLSQITWEHRRTDRQAERWERNSWHCTSGEASPCVKAEVHHAAAHRWRTLGSDTDFPRVKNAKRKTATERAAGKVVVWHLSRA